MQKSSALLLTSCLLTAFTVNSIADSPLASLPGGAPSEESTTHQLSVRLHARPLPEQKSFIVTDAGLYYELTNNLDVGDRFRWVWDLGVMFNVGTRNAIGASWFVTADFYEIAIGPELRYRRWFGHEQSVDVAIGTRLPTGSLSNGSVIGLVKYSPVQWLGIAVRPESIRHEEYDVTTNTTHTVTSGRVYAGLELSGVPGASVFGVSAVIAVLLSLFVSNND